MLERKLNGLVMDHAVVEIQIRLQRPQVDIEKCTGCGLCEHECPVNGKKAIRVSAEGETRNPKRALLLKRS
jgi:ferredoxin